MLSAVETHTLRSVLRTIINIQCPLAAPLTWYFVFICTLFATCIISKNKLIFWGAD
eukprot:XP_001705522.1 Hypothetical protein GL50803_38079 [Giardia lamblia ATCC 50803]